VRPSRLTVPLPESRSFDLRHERVPYFATPWHFHPELELNHVVAGTGTRFIGQSVERFEGGEIILLGRNLPHYWKSDAAFYGPDPPGPSEAVVVRFAEDFVGKLFLELPETRRMQALFGRAALGLRLLEPLRGRVADGLLALTELTGFSQLAALLVLLNDIAESDDVAVVSPRYVPSEVLEKQSERLNRVMAYLMEHFTEPVSLPVVADLANMNQAAFCRYFRSQTGQTLTQFVTDLRIRYACELLTKRDDPIALVSEAVGFGNVSHFVQLFRKARHQTPAAFRKGLNRP
jgi:AraC-like DNA-binding protein